MGVSVRAISKVRKPRSGSVRRDRYTYSGRPKCHFGGVAVAVAERFVSTITVVTHINERILRLGITHRLGVTSLVSVYAPKGVR